MQNFSVVTGDLDLGLFAEVLTWPSLLVVAGSRAYGLEHEGSDYDYRGFYTLPTDRVLDLRGYSDSVSAPEELGVDAVMWELGKFCRLALAGNPHALEVLWAPPELVRYCDDEGAALRKFRDRFLSQRARATYGGFLTSEIKRLGRLRAQLDSADEVGDTLGHRKRYRKAVAHCFRLARQGLEVLTTGTLTLRVTDREELLNKAELPLNDVVAELRTLRDQLDSAQAVIPLEPDVDGVNELLIAVRRRLL